MTEREAWNIAVTECALRLHLFPRSIDPFPTELWARFDGHSVLFWGRWGRNTASVTVPVDHESVLHCIYVTGCTDSDILCASWMPEWDQYSSIGCKHSVSLFWMIATGQPIPWKS